MIVKMDTDAVLDKMTEVCEVLLEQRLLYDNEVIRRFLHAQREFSSVQSKVSPYFIKAVELGRKPGPQDLEKGACGCGGSCGGH